jgi:general secretion pathway protein A
MYKNFFGLKERPFALVPNPAYFYLSTSHEEALAHLTYALSEGDGFVEITGEVGTGKTTLCRIFLENLAEDTEAAYIFNPKLSSFQLIKAINDEFSIDSAKDSIKDLIDALNQFLIAKKTEGKRVILIIDEAQNLSKSVLEQLRLLSNLETTTSKLLQIILVGQPELGELLDSYELRQLSQRITLSCHLSSLTRKETKAYILHRIRVASQKSELTFSPGAHRAIFAYSGGLPRLINIVCDRALLTAFGLNRKKIDSGIIRTSIRELSSRGDRLKQQHVTAVRRAFIFILALLLLAGALFYYFFASHRLTIQRSKNPTAQQATPANTAKAKNLLPFQSPLLPSKDSPASAANDQLSKSKPIDLPRTNSSETAEVSPEAAINRFSRREALLAAIKCWGIDGNLPSYMDAIDDDLVFFRLFAKQNDLLVHRMKGDLDLIAHLNLPAILKVQGPEDNLFNYLTLIKIIENTFLLKGSRHNGLLAKSRPQLNSIYLGEAFILWRNWLSIDDTVSSAATQDAIVALKLYLKKIGFDQIESGPVYDESLTAVIKSIQQKHGIPADGIVGTLTKIIICNENDMLPIPHLVDAAVTSKMNRNDRERTNH